MEEVVHRDALAAWQYLCERGGIELDGRDEGLDERIRQRLEPTAASLEAALSAATLDAFARAFFEAVHPYVAMFEDILEFFRRANATMGQSQWTLALDNVDMSLEHFRKCLDSWRGGAQFELEVPAIDWRGVWRLWKVLREREEIHQEVDRVFEGASLSVPADVESWVDAYNRGEYLALPESLTKDRCPEELWPSASVAHAGLLRLLELRVNREQLKEIYASRRGKMDSADALDFWCIAQNETDYWLRTFVVALSAAATHLSSPQLRELGCDLDSITSQFPMRPLEARLSVADLERVVSLPIWEKRYELYSVWVATEIVRALPEHNVEIHHEDGRIAFAFRETLVATIHSSPGPFTLVSERRSPLRNPRGAGRVGGVQPDHALWTVEKGEEVCRLAVEVKHYKKSAKAKFVDVFEDYARAFPDGDVFLVSHGPTGNAVYEVSRVVKGRCHAIGRLTPSGFEGRKELADAVRECIGDPIACWPKGDEPPNTDRVMVVDVSSSMKAKLQSLPMEAFVRELISLDRPKKLVAVNCDIVGEWPADRAGYAALQDVCGGSTSLRDPIGTLLEDHKSAVVVTDQDGLSTLESQGRSPHRAEDRAPEGIVVMVCR